MWKFCFFLVFLAAAAYAQETDADPYTFDCKLTSLLEPCLNNGTCPEDGGHCGCPDGIAGYDCGYNETSVSTLSEADCGFICQNGATCLDNDGTTTCYCAEGFTGESCELKRVDIVCNAESVDVTVRPYFTDAFNGLLVVLTNGTDQCSTEPVDNVIEANFPFEECGGANREIADNNDETISFDVLLTHDSLLTVISDRRFSIDCLVKASGSTFDRSLNVGADTREALTLPSGGPQVGQGLLAGNAPQRETFDVSNLEQRTIGGTLEPFEARLRDPESGDDIDSPVAVGTPVELAFILDQSQEVYTTFRVLSVTVTNGLEDADRQELEFVSEGCATRRATRASKVVTNFDGDNTDTISVFFNAFKVRGSSVLTFETTSILCSNNSVECNVTAHTCDEDTQESNFQALGRKRRSADQIILSDSEALESVTTVLEVFIPGEDEAPNTVIPGRFDPAPSIDQCMSSVGFLILAVTSAVLFLLLVTVFIIFCVRLIHKTSKTSSSATIKSFDNTSYMS